MTVLEKAELIFPIDLRGINSLSKTSITPLGSEIINFQDFYLVFLPEKDRLARLRLTTEKTKEDFGIIYSDKAKTAIYADLKETHPRDFVSWGNFEAKEIPQNLYDRYYDSITFSLFFRRLKHSNRGLTVDGNLEGALNFSNISNNIVYGFRASIGSSIIIVRSSHMRDAIKRQKHFLGTSLVLVRLPVSFLEYFPNGNYVEREIDISMELREYRQIVTAMADKDNSRFLCILFATSESHWGGHQLEPFTLVLRIYELDKFSLVLLSALGVPVPTSLPYTKAIFIDKKTLGTFFNGPTVEIEDQVKAVGSYRSISKVTDTNNGFLVEWVSSKTIAKLVRLYCETRDYDLFSEYFLSEDIITGLSVCKKQLQKSRNFIKGQLINARTAFLLRDALGL